MLSRNYQVSKQILCLPLEPSQEDGAPPADESDLRCVGARSFASFASSAGFPVPAHHSRECVAEWTV